MSAMSDSGDVLPLPPISGGLGTVEDGSFSACQWLPCRKASGRSIRPHPRSMKNGHSIHRGEDETTLSSAFARRQHQKFDQTCIDCTSGKTSTGFRRTWLPRENVANYVQTQRSRLSMIRACGSMHSDRESGFEPVCEVPPEHRHSRAGRLSLLTQRVAGTCLDDC